MPDILAEDFLEAAAPEAVGTVTDRTVRLPQWLKALFFAFIVH